MEYIEVQLANNEVAWIRRDQVAAITGRDKQEEHQHDPERIDSIRWASKRGSFVIPASVNIPAPEAQPATCKVRLVDGTELKSRGTARDLQAQLLLASRPAWRVAWDWIKQQKARFYVG